MKYYVLRTKTGEQHLTAAALVKLIDNVLNVTETQIDGRDCAIVIIMDVNDKGFEANGKPFTRELLPLWAVGS